MKRSLFCFISIFLLSLPSFAQETTIEQKMLHLASKFEYEELKQLYHYHGDELPPIYRHYCLFSLYKSSFDYSKALTEIDSLTQEYSEYLPYHTKLSLVYYKAQLLFQTQQYKALADFCKKKIKFYKYVKDAQQLREELTQYRKKALQILNASPIDSLLLSEAFTENYFRLQEDYNKFKHQADSFTKMWCSFLINRSFNISTAVDQIITIDSLITKHSDALTSEEVNQLFIASSKLYLQGFSAKIINTYHTKWKDLSHRFNLYDSTFFWLRYIETVKDKPASKTVETEASNCIPFSREEFITITCKINKIKIPDFFLDTSSPFTLISKKMAQKCKLQKLPLHFKSNSILASSEVQLAIAEEFQIGNIVFHHLPVAVIDSMNTSLNSNDFSILGMDVLSRLGKISFSDSTLKLFLNKDSIKAKEPNLFFTQDDKLMLKASTPKRGKDSTLFFSIETAIIKNYLSTQELMEDSRNFRINEACLRLPNRSLINSIPYYYAGHLGLSFLRSFENVTLDFNKMQLVEQGPRPYHYSYYQEDLNKGNWARIEKQLSFYDLTLSTEINQLLHLIIASKKHQSKQVLLLVKEVLKKNTSNLPLSLIEDLRYEALFDLGHYSEAKKVAQQLADYCTTDESKIKRLQQEEKLCEHLEKESPLNILFEKDQDRIKAKWNKEDLMELKVKINNRKIKGYIDITKSFCYISKKTARKIHAQTILTNYPLKDDTVNVALLKELYLGGIKIQNLICLIVDKEEYPFIIGNSLLMKIPQITFEQKHFAYTIHPTKNEFNSPLYVDNNSLITTAYNNGDELLLNFKSKDNINIDHSIFVAPYLKINNYFFPISSTFKSSSSTTHNRNKGSLGLRFFIKKERSVTFNFKEMTWNLFTP